MKTEYIKLKDRGKDYIVTLRGCEEDVNDAIEALCSVCKNGFLPNINNVETALALTLIDFVDLDWIVTPIHTANEIIIDADRNLIIRRGEHYEEV